MSVRQRKWRYWARTSDLQLIERVLCLRRPPPLSYFPCTDDPVGHASRGSHDHLCVSCASGREKVGREVIDGFETAVRREGAHKGFVIAFSFTKGAYDEVARVKAEGLEIALVAVRTLLDNPPDREPQPGLDEMIRELLEGARQAAQASLPRGSAWSQPRPGDTRPTIAELIASDLG